MNPIPFYLKLRKMTTMGPWTLGACIYDMADKKIYEATSDTLNSTDKWVVKVKPNVKTTELYTLLSLNLESQPPNMIKLPPCPYHTFGMTPEYVWFAMRQYDGHVTKDNAGSWKEIAKACISFMEILHCEHHRVYMDFKLDNILVNGSEFIVSDYENITQVETNKLTSASRSTKWYYMARGGEPDEWLYSWKMDLMSLAYMLITLTSDEKDVKICDQLIRQRFGKRSINSSMKKIALKRNKIMYEAANPVLKQYLDIIKDLPWDDWDPPSYKLYSSLSALFV